VASHDDNVAVAECDQEYVEDIGKVFVPFIDIKVSEECLPGSVGFESD
jgi:hypothetical protein